MPTLITNEKYVKVIGSFRVKSTKFQKLILIVNIFSEEI